MKRYAIIIIALLSVMDNSMAQKSNDRSSALEGWNAMKYGMFIHWGDFSALGGIYEGEKIPRLGEQIQRHAKAPSSEYEKTVSDFNPVLFDADEWVGIAKNAGMKYIVITVKHHNGFCIWDTETTQYNIADATPFKRDPVRELAEACKRAGLGFGVYFSTIDWHFPGAVEREKPGEFSVSETIPEAHHLYSIAQLEELCSGRYGELVQVFFDMGLPTPAQSKDYRNTVKSLLPDCQINGRVMNNMGDFLTMPDNAVPKAPIPQAWEAPSTLYHWSKNEIPGWSNEWWNTWGYKSWIPSPPLEMQVKKQLHKMAMIVSRGGNFLLNVGPDGAGRIIPYEQEVLREMGLWLEQYGEAVFETSPTPFARNPEILCTQKAGKLYFFLDYEMKGTRLELPGLDSPISSAYLLSDQNRTALDVTSVNHPGIALPGEFANPCMEVLVVEYDGELKISTPIIKPSDHKLQLSYHDAYITGSYDSESYSSLANDTHANWDVQVDKAGKYEVHIELKSKADPGQYTLQVGEDRFPVAVKNNEFKGMIASLKLDKAEQMKVSLYPSLPKYIFSNGYARFSRLLVDDVSISITRQ